jgi:hypothetical protein
MGTLHQDSQFVLKRAWAGASRLHTLCDGDYENKTSPSFPNFPLINGRTSLAVASEGAVWSRLPPLSEMPLMVAKRPSQTQFRAADRLIEKKPIR